MRIYIGVCTGNPHAMMGFCSQRNPHLLPIDYVFISISPGGAIHAGNVRAGSRFGETITCDLITARLRHQEALLLFFRPPLQQAHAVQPHMDRHHDPQRGIDRFQFFTRQTQRNIIHTLTAVAHWYVYPQDAELTHARQHKWSHFVSAVVLFDGGRDLLLGKISHHLLHHAMFVV